MDDTKRLDWIQQRKAIVRYREYLPDNQRTDKPWWVCAAFANPFTGVILRDAIDKAIASEKNEA